MALSRAKRRALPDHHVAVGWMGALALAMSLASPACALSASGNAREQAQATQPADPVGEDHPLSAFFDNTMIVVEPARTLKVWYNRDRTFAAQDEKDGFRFTGVWENRGSDFCQTQTSPPRPGEAQWRRCGKIGPYQVGDHWERTAPDGAKIYISLVPGR